MWNEKEKGYIYGLYEGDGYAYHNKKDRHYSVEFYLDSERNKDIQKFLVSLLKKENFNVHIFKDKRFNCNRIRVHSKQFFEFINKKNRKFSRNFKIGFVSGMIDSEGYVNPNKRMIRVCNTDKELLLLMCKFLRFLGINYSLKKKKRGIKDKIQQYVVSISIRFKKLNHVSQKAGRESSAVITANL